MELNHYSTIKSASYKSGQSREAHLFRLGVPAFSQQAVEAVELDLLWTAQHRPYAFGELLCYLKLVLSQCWPSPRQQLIQHHTIGEHVHLQKPRNVKVRFWRFVHDVNVKYNLGFKRVCGWR